MAIIIQKVTGQTHKQWFFPALAGVGFSRNPSWTPSLRRGGLCAPGDRIGTRVASDDYPRIGLSYPTLRPDQPARSPTTALHGRGRSEDQRGYAPFPVRM